MNLFVARSQEMNFISTPTQFRNLLYKESVSFWLIFVWLTGLKLVVGTQVPTSSKGGKVKQKLNTNLNYTKCRLLQALILMDHYFLKEFLVTMSF